MKVEINLIVLYCIVLYYILFNALVSVYLLQQTIPDETRRPTDIKMSNCMGFRQPSMVKFETIE